MQFFTFQFEQEMANIINLHSIKKRLHIFRTSMRKYRYFKENPFQKVSERQGG